MSNTHKFLIGSLIVGLAIFGITQVAGKAELTAGLRQYFTNVGVSISKGTLNISPKIRLDNNSNTPLIIDRILATVYQYKDGIWEPIGSTKPTAKTYTVGANATTDINIPISIPLLSSIQSAFSSIVNSEARRYKVEAIITALGVEKIIEKEFSA
jgi:hypothetical protein